MRTAVAEELAEGYGDVDPKDLMQMSEVLMNMFHIPFLQLLCTAKLKIHKVKNE